MGMKEFDRVLKQKAATMNLIDTRSLIIGSGQALVLGGQFVTYKMTNSIGLTLKHFPLYDDPTCIIVCYIRYLVNHWNLRMGIADLGRRDGG